MRAHGRARLGGAVLSAPSAVCLPMQHYVLAQTREDGVTSSFRRKRWWNTRVCARFVAMELYPRKSCCTGGS